MQKFTFHISLFTFLFFLHLHSSAQEIISELKYNSALIFDKHHSQLRSLDTLELPFIDDFSYSLLDPNHKYPDQNLWMDKDCFVNTTYPILPPSIGVATFDGLDEYGIPHDTAVQIDLSENYSADSLTSMPINTNSLTVADSVYFSFFYQKMGIGDYPNAGDSLILEFKKANGDWNSVWKMDGDASTPVVEFIQVMILLNETDYFYPDFQFRFRNLATTSGNNDHWHVDYIRLDKNRNFADVILQDVAAVYTPGTILKNYQFMPWTQFKNNQTTELAATFSFVIHNISSNSINANFKYSAIETFSPYILDTMFSNLPTGNSFNFFSQTFQTLNNSTGYDTATINGDSASLLIKCKIISDVFDINTRNDTSNRIQPFFNYYAHDDGSAEKAYALYGSGSKLAYKFYANIPDTLRAIQYHFSHLNADVTNKFLSLMVWNSVLPSEQILYEEDFLHPSYIDSINGFTTYILSTPVAISDTFYVGWLQTYPDYLNIGFDKNIDSHESVYYKTSVNLSFTQSQLIGSPMIRPVVGAKLPFTSAQNISANTISVQCFPNPTSEILHVNVQGVKYAELNITDLSGRVIQTSEGTVKNIFVGNLVQGMYLLTVKDKAGKQTLTTRFIKM